LLLVGRILDMMALDHGPKKPVRDKSVPETQSGGDHFLLSVGRVCCKARFNCWLKSP